MLIILALLKCLLSHLQMKLSILMFKLSDETYIVRQYIHGKLSSSWKAFGIPLVARICNSVNGSDIYNLFLKLINPFLITTEGITINPDSSNKTVIDEVEMKDAMSPVLSEGANDINEKGVNPDSDAELQFFLTDDKGSTRDSKLVMDEPVTRLPKRLNLLVFWPEKKIEQCDIRLFGSLPEIFKSGFIARRPHESVSLYRCLEAFLKEEPLGPDDMWSVCMSSL